MSNLWGSRPTLRSVVIKPQNACVRGFTETFLVWGYLCLGNIPANAVYLSFICNPTRNLR